MHQARDPADDWLARAAEQALALRELVQGEPDLRDSVDVLLFQLAQRLAERDADDGS